MDQFIGVGRRKTATARCYLRPGSGKILINRCDPKEYFCDLWQYSHALEPLEAVGVNNNYDIIINVKGGGITGQAGAVRLGISRALVIANQDYRHTLKSLGMLRRDPRKVERKKYGRPGARKKFQFSKR